VQLRDEVRNKEAPARRASTALAPAGGRIATARSSGNMAVTAGDGLVQGKSIQYPTTERLVY
jgi:hypothetical protein